MTTARQFLVSTTHALLLLDAARKTVSTVHSGMGLYFGLAKTDSHYFIGCRNETRGPVNEEARSKEAGSILVLDEALQPVDELKPNGFALRDVHGVAVFDDKLWVCCSFDNAVATYDLATRTWDLWYPASDPAARGKDTHHFNGIGVMDDQIYVVAHHWGPSRVYFYDRRTRQLISSLGMGRLAHDFFQMNGVAATCSSGNGELVTSEGGTLRMGGFPRGVSVEGDDILVGISGVVPRAQRASADGGIRIFNPHWRQTHWVDLPATGMVLDILPVRAPQAPNPSFAPWPGAEFEAPLPELTWRHPGVWYSASAADSMFEAADWHACEPDRRWSCARVARMSIPVNFEDRGLIVEVSNTRAKPTRIEFTINGKLAGSLVARSNQDEHLRLSLESCEPGRRAALTIAVPELWRPKLEQDGSTDERWLGISLKTIRFVAE